MHQSKLVELYRTLGKSELRRLHKFIDSSYFNESDVLKTMHHYISKNLHKSGNQLIRENVHNHVFPGVEFDYGKLRYFMARLLKLVEQFLFIEHMQSQADASEQEIVKILKSREANRNYNAKINELKESNATSRISDKSYLRAYYREELLLEYHGDNIADYNAYLSQNLKNSIEHLDKFYIVQKLKHLCAILNHQNVLNLDFEILFKDEILEQIEQGAFIEVPHIVIYRLILKTLTQPEEPAHFVMLKKILIDDKPDFEIDELKEIYAYAQNYCIRKINKGKSDYLNEIFDLYRSGLEQQILLQGETLSERNYKNIVVTGLRLGKHEWVLQFIDQYKPMLQDDVQDNAYRYNLAKYHFHLGDHDKVLNLLQEVEYNDVFYGIDSRSMLMKTYYEIKEFDALFSFMSSFKTFLNRKRLVSEHHRQANQNLISHLKKLTAIPYRERESLESLRLNVLTASPLADKNWLIEKIDEQL